MAMTQQVKSELAAAPIPPAKARRAEVSAMLRFGGGLHLVSGRIVVEAEFDTAGAARRLRSSISELFGFESELLMISASGLRRGSRYTVRMIRHGEDVARQTGLVDAKRRPVRGLPPQIVGGSIADAAAAWRGAFLAHGSLTEPGRSMALEITCPSAEAALALTGCARRLGVAVKSREARGVERVVVRDGEVIANLLTQMGASESRLVWEEHRLRREVRAQANRLANFDDANLRRSARAAVAASARVERALEILGDSVPPHLLAAGELRLAHREASLEELGRLHEPALTKDAVAGRIRRLLATADKVAAEQGIPGTEASLPLEEL